MPAHQQLKKKLEEEKKKELSASTSFGFIDTFFLSITVIYAND